MAKNKKKYPRVLYGRARWNSLDKSSEKRNINFNITLEELSNWGKITPEKCYYCGLSSENYNIIKDYLNYNESKNSLINKYQWQCLAGHRKHISILTVDRKDNNRGYEMGNIVKSCWFCNWLKGAELTEEEMLKKGSKEVKKFIKAVIKEFEAKVKKETENLEKLKKYVGK